MTSRPVGAVASIAITRSEAFGIPGDGRHRPSVRHPVKACGVVIDHWAHSVRQPGRVEPCRVRRPHMAAASCHARSPTSGIVERSVALPWQTAERASRPALAKAREKDDAARMAAAEAATLKEDAAKAAGTEDAAAEAAAAESPQPAVLKLVNLLKPGAVKDNCAGNRYDWLRVHHPETGHWPRGSVPSS